MEEYDMKITFIHHSSFCVEIKNKVFIFDYFDGNHLNNDADFYKHVNRNLTGNNVIEEIYFSGRLPELKKEQNIYVFASHKHEDHFDMEILKWREEYPHIQYIFPKEMKFSDNYLSRHGIDLQVKEQIHYMNPNTELSIGDIKIETLKSTDAGVAFLVSYAGKTIYHAGDLHWWHWENDLQKKSHMIEENEDLEQQKNTLFLQYQERMYKDQIDKLRNRKIDVAFVVLDTRLSEGIFRGIDYFMNVVDATYVIPMHLWQKYEVIAEYKNLPQVQKFRERILEVTEENQIWNLS